ncbi:hypothetical protein Nepgr_025730 [Nepenthes gracilis]|uniref:MADS-box domain-containing protein n=1 Tax=Nepenthes gracilis TaxID=150966 RepID=A0AAD3T727_NEPGR|nr:hypothetical protein Nepgr_025730 [Nepenthes gracilis]
MISDKNKKHVTFSKRRSGLFKKASELCVLCGAEVAIITCSEAGKVFCFGHPTADAVIKRYLHGKSSSSSSSSSTPPLGLAQQSNSNVINTDYSVMVHKYNEEYERVRKEIDLEKNSNDYNSNYTTNTNNGGFWWEEPIDNLGLHDLELFMASLEELRNNVARRADDLTLFLEGNNDQIGWKDQIEQIWESEDLPDTGISIYQPEFNNYLGFVNQLMPIMEDDNKAICTNPNFLPPQASFNI